MRQELLTGTVRFFSVKGFGFITPSAGDEDWYFHASQLDGRPGERSIQTGTPVTFVPGRFRGKTVATEVRPLPLAALEDQAGENE
jgi:cold shock CspA family protein